MQVENVAISALAFDPANARKHDTKNLEAIKGSLARFGQQKPIVVGKGNCVIAGNGTLEAAKALGWDKIDVVRTELEGSEATAFAIACEKTSRRCFGMELDPKYCDTILTRWEQFTGKQATLSSALETANEDSTASEAMAVPEGAERKSGGRTKAPGRTKEDQGAKRP